MSAHPLQLYLTVPTLASVPLLPIITFPSTTSTSPSTTTNNKTASSSTSWLSSSLNKLAYFPSSLRAQPCPSYPSPAPSASTPRHPPQPHHHQLPPGPHVAAAFVQHDDKQGPLPRQQPSTRRSLPEVSTSLHPEGEGTSAPISQLAAKATKAVMKQAMMKQHTAGKKRRIVDIPQEKKEGVCFLPVARSGRQLVKGIIPRRPRSSSSGNANTEKTSSFSSSSASSSSSTSMSFSLTSNPIKNCSDEVQRAVSPTPLAHASPDRTQINQTARKAANKRPLEAVSDTVVMASAMSSFSASPVHKPKKRRRTQAANLQVSDELSSGSHEVIHLDNCSLPSTPELSERSYTHVTFTGHNQNMPADPPPCQLPPQQADPTIPEVPTSWPLPPARWLIALSERPYSESSLLPGPPLTSLLSSSMFRD